MPDDTAPPPSYTTRFYRAVAPPQGSWFQRHGRTLGYGVAAGAGVAVAGLLVWGVYDFVIGGGGGPNNPTGCTAASDQWQTDENSIQSIILANPNGIPSGSGPAQQIQTLSTDAGTQMGSIGKYCSPTCSGIIGCSEADVQAFMGNYGAYLGWGIILVTGYAAYSFLSRRWGNKANKPQNQKPPKGFSPSTVAPAAAMAMWIDLAQDGSVTPSEATAAVNAIGSTFPITTVASTWSAQIEAQAATAQNQVVAQGLNNFVLASLDATVVTLDLSDALVDALVVIAAL